MIYILDGYNIIKSGNSGPLKTGTLEQQRLRLARIINDNKPWGNGKNRTIIVYDGSRGSLFPDNQKVGGVEIVFSTNGSADDVIVGLVTDSANKSNVVVVSDDKGIRQRTGRMHPKYMSVNEFLKKLFSAPNKKYKPKRRSMNDSEIEKINKELTEKWELD